MDKINVDYYMGTATFFVEIEAASDKTLYKGKFKVKCILSPLEYLNADSMYRELLGKINPQLASEYVNRIAFSLAQLKYRVMECPDWFKSPSTGITGNIDDRVMLHVFDKAVEAESDYRNGIEERYKKANESVRKAVDDGELTNGKKEEELPKEETKDDFDLDDE